MAVAVQDAVPGKFVLHNLEDQGISACYFACSFSLLSCSHSFSPLLTDYCRTLREWDRRLDANFHGEVLDDLRARYPSLRSEKNLKAFKRKWHYMFMYAEVGYARAYTSLNCWTFARPVSHFCSL